MCNCVWRLQTLAIAWQLRPPPHTSLLLASIGHATCQHTWPLDSSNRLLEQSTHQRVLDRFLHRCHDSHTHLACSQRESSNSGSYSHAEVVFLSSAAMSLWMCVTHHGNLLKKLPFSHLDFSGISHTYFVVLHRSAKASQNCAPLMHDD